MKGIRFYKSDIINSIEVKECSNMLHSSKTHFHEELSIGFINKGSTNLTINNAVYSLSSGDVIVIYPFVNHKCLPEDLKNWDFKMYYIEKSLYNNKFADCNFRNIIKVFSHNDKGYSSLKKFGNLMDMSPKSEQIEEELKKVLEYVFNPDVFKSGKITAEKTASVKKYINENYLDSFLLSDIEEKFKVNKYSIIREFKKIYNTTPSAYQLELKINYAKKLLNTCDDIAGIALDAGFYDQPHFTREFKNAYGITPMEYYKSTHLY